VKSEAKRVPFLVSHKLKVGKKALKEILRKRNNAALIIY
jgi:hypothetical protein